MGIEVVKASADEKPLIAEMMQVYLDELSAYSHEEPEEDGLYDLGEHFDAFWTEATRFPFVIWADGDIAGFCLVRQVSIDCHEISEFFITEPYRRMGIGTLAARAMFRHFPQRWQVTEIETNYIAQAFWIQTISTFTNGEYQESWSNGTPEGPMQTFAVEAE